MHFIDQVCPEPLTPPIMVRGGSVLPPLCWVRTFTIVLPIAPEDKKIGSWQPIMTIEAVMAEYRRGIFVTSVGGELVRLAGTGPKLVARIGWLPAGPITNQRA